MTTITKEWLQQTISEFENTRDDIPFGLDEDDAKILEVLKRSLASMDRAQEPVYQWREAFEDGARWDDCTKEQYDGFCKDQDCETRILYAAPQPLTDAERAELQESRRILAGLPQLAIDGGWTAAGASAHARCLEDELAAKDAELQQYRKAASEAVAWLWSHRKHKSEVTLTRPEDDERAEGALWSGWTCQPLAAVRPVSQQEVKQEQKK